MIDKLAGFGAAAALVLSPLWLGMAHDPLHRLAPETAHGTADADGRLALAPGEGGGALAAQLPRFGAGTRVTVRYTASLPRWSAIARGPALAANGVYHLRWRAHGHDVARDYDAAAGGFADGAPADLGGSAATNCDAAVNCFVPGQADSTSPGSAVTAPGGVSGGGSAATSPAAAGSATTEGSSATTAGTTAPSQPLDVGGALVRGIERSVDDTPSSSAGATKVPEPAMPVLFALACGALPLRRKLAKRA